MPSKTWVRLVERFGGVEGARAYSREKKAERQRAGKVKDDPRRYVTATMTPGRWRARHVMRARRRAREAGLEATIKASDLHWPEFCPVLGVKLLYQGEEGDPGHRVSLDRWDNSKGYVPGNVYVISYRANALKNNATVHEMACVLDYMQTGPIWL